MAEVFHVVCVSVTFIAKKLILVRGGRNIRVRVILERGIQVRFTVAEKACIFILSHINTDVYMRQNIDVYIPVMWLLLLLLLLSLLLLHCCSASSYEFSQTSTHILFPVTTIAKHMNGCG